MFAPFKDDRLPEIVTSSSERTVPDEMNIAPPKPSLLELEECFAVFNVIVALLISISLSAR